MSVDGERELPEGWAWAALGDVADTALGKMLDKKQSTGLHPTPYLRNVNVQWGQIDTDDLLTMDIEPDDLSRFMVSKGDLVVCEGGEIGRCAIWHKDEPIAFQKALHRVRPSQALDNRYLRYYLEYAASTGKLAKFSTGSTIKHLPQQRLREVPVLLAPLAEQRRIVEALEEQLSRLDVAEREIRRNLSRVDRTWNAVRSSVARGEANGFSVSGQPRRVEDVATVSGGIQKQKKRAPVRNKFPFLRVANVGSGKLDLTDVHEVELFSGELSRHRLEKGDLLVVEGNGSPEQIGRAAMWHGGIDDAVHQNHLIRVRPNGALLPDYLELIWNSPAVVDQLRKVARSTSGLYTLSTSKVKSVTIPVPDLTDQQRLVEAAVNWQIKLNAARGSLERAVVRSKHLRMALLRTAFSGKLVPSDLSSESAEVALARVAAERAAEPRAARTRKTAVKRVAVPCAATPADPAPEPTPAPALAVQQEFDL
ncbi:restriction endonuclease subunit S [Streptomyces viridochromogenes]|uniref:restriction endonuclease subunit S n=1 Tax=Streptomyces viridochromogenes TaxID=1938 RepID=UPI0031DC1F14